MGKPQLFSSTALAGLLLAPSAFAGGLAPLPYPESQKLSWSGFYLGANGGEAWSFDPHTACIGSSFPCSTVAYPAVRASGGEIGAQAGYNWQVGKFVVGVEGDAQKLFASGSSQFAGADPGKGPDRLSSSYDWLGTARVRAGVSTGSILFYATGGLAYGRVGHDYTFAVGSSSSKSLDLFENRMGWAAGAGAEYAFNKNWSLKAEYLYVHLDGSSMDVTSIFGGSPGSSVLHFNNNLNIVRLGANYRF